MFLGRPEGGRRNREPRAGAFPLRKTGHADSLAILMYNSLHAVVAELADALA
jgi:hypothetical protein